MEQLTNQLWPHQWLSLPIEVQLFLATEFNIPRSGSISVVDNQIESDGRTVEDLSVLTIEKLQDYTKSYKEGETFHELLEKAITKFNKSKKNAKTKGEESTENEGTN